MFRYWVRLMFGRHHPWRQHDRFNGLSEPASPSLRELGARMCSIVGRRDKTTAGTCRLRPLMANGMREGDEKEGGPGSALFRKQ
jgi:hypothetical protein